MNRTFAVACLLFFSGMCALVYQVAWFREFRLVFGASHPASAAVLAVFMGGLGLGNYLLGKRADQHPMPLSMYATLELGISIACALTPWLTDLVRALYISVGGQMTLGGAAATVVRLLLAVIVLGIPTILMGGTLPAAARAVTSHDDRSRHGIGWLYGMNTFGAVAGAAASTFFLLEFLGTRTTLWLACLVNLLTSIVARELSRRFAAQGAVRAVSPANAESAETASPRSTDRPASPTSRAANSAAEPKGKGKSKGNLVPAALDAPPPAGVLPGWLVYTSAGIVGFAFFLMELVWYRMLGPLLGGTTFTFGLILAVALAGIGIGGALYAMLYRERSPTLGSFAITCALEALCIAIPYALGDRLAVLTAVLRDMGVFGFYGEAIGWIVVASIVVLPAAIVSGVQFPLLIALVGRSDVSVGKQVGLAFAWNTVGAIAGSLAGGFGALPGLGALGTWRAVVWLLCGLGAAALVYSFSRTERGERLRAVLCGGVLAASLACLWAMGPTAAWRHSAIGAGRSGIRSWTANGVRDWMNHERRVVQWEADGIETSVAINTQNGLAFYVNGKSDGSALFDAPTQIMAGLTGAILHGDPKTALVVGLGTGETTGWLAQVSSMETVDVVELEPAIDEMARRCAAINHNVLDHPKVNRIYTDAREVLLTTKRKYDLIISEPSNPYRAGVANLYTQEYYAAALARLNERGLFCQFLQAYEVDAQTIRTVLETLRSVFKHVEVWETKPQDMLLVCSDHTPLYSVSALRERITREPFKSALATTWRTSQVEGFLSCFTAGAELIDHMKEHAPEPINTDDHNRIEYGFARTVGQATGFSLAVLRAAAYRHKAHRPPVEGGPVDWQLVEDLRMAAYARELSTVLLPPDADDGQRARGQAWRAYLLFAMREAVDQWSKQSREPSPGLELMMVAHAHADIDHADAPGWIEKLRHVQPTEAQALAALRLFRQKKNEEAVEALEKLFAAMQHDPWGDANLLRVVMNTCPDLAKSDAKYAQRLHAAIKRPFMLYLLEEQRRGIAIEVAKSVGHAAVVESLQAVEPNPPWNKDVLSLRYNTYQATSHPLFPKAEKDLNDFLKYAPDERILPD